MKNIIAALLSCTGYACIKNSSLRTLEKSLPAYAFASIIALAKGNHSLLEELLTSFPDSKSQYAQDMFALFMCYQGKGKYFVEFGATDGITCSNTYLLEKKYGWKGILIEPSRQFHEQLCANRSCHIDTRCVSSKSGQYLDFEEVYSSGISRIRTNKIFSLPFAPSCYSVQSITLIDLLDEYEAPSYIDYLSIDVEGHELSVLSGIDFGKYKFGCITIEHNYSRDSLAIKQRITDNGYVCVFEGISLYDFWFVPVEKYNELFNGHGDSA